MLACDTKRTFHGSILLVSALVLTQCGCTYASARSVLQTFLPQGSDACDNYVQSSCTSLSEAAPRTDSCSQQNAQQMATDVAAADKLQVRFYSTDANPGHADHFDH